MEIVKARTQPELLKALNHLDKRMTLSVLNKQHIMSMEKGYEGEKQFDSLVKEIVEADVLVLNDLLLTISEQTVQIDSLIVTAETAYLYEIKNYKGDYQMRSGQLLTLTGQEIGNPITQLKRTASLLRQLFQQWNTNITVEASVVYVNATFGLYHARPEDAIIMPNQIRGHLKKIDRQRVTLPKKQRYLAERLLSEHKKTVPFQKQLPDYDYHELKKGLTCNGCGSFDIRLNQRTAKCPNCNYSLSADEIIIEQIEEFKLLFPDEKMNVKNVTEWCGDSVSRRRIPRVLGKYYKKAGSSRATYYK